MYTLWVFLLDLEDELEIIKTVVKEEDRNKFGSFIMYQPLYQLIQEGKIYDANKTRLTSMISQGYNTAEKIWDLHEDWIFISDIFSYDPFNGIENHEFNDNHMEFVKEHTIQYIRDKGKEYGLNL